MTSKFDGWPRKTIGHLFSSVLHQSLCIISNPLVTSNCSYSPETANLGKNWRFSVLCDVEIWWMTLTDNRALLLCYFKLCKSFQSHRWIQTGVTVRKCAIPLKISDICPLWPFTVENPTNWLPWKTIGHLFYATSRFEHHFIAICEFERYHFT